MRTVLATIQRGRLDHLRKQAAAVALLSPAPHAYLVVSMDEEPTEVPEAHTVWAPVRGDAPAPLAAARNLAIDRAEHDHDAQLVVLLDVDCLPSRNLVGRCVDAAKRQPSALLAGAVRYLPPGVPRGPIPVAAEIAATPPHPGRPAPPAGELVLETRAELFWSLSFAVTPATHRKIGGFDEGYEGYGAEDTDYGRRAAARGVPFYWVGGAEAYHLHHPVSRPPLEHLDSIVPNARRFHARWGEWPMPDHLEAFADRGWVRKTADGDLEITDAGRDASRWHARDQGTVS